MLIRYVLAVLFLFTPWAQAESLRILHVASYHMDWEWSRQQFQAFMEELQDLDIEYRIVELDAKRRSAGEIRIKTEEAVRLIQEWKPHLVYANDDAAQEAVTSRFLNHAIPFVYSGLNKAPHDYGFEQASNVAGVLEREHFLPSLRLLKSIQPHVRKLAVVTDTDPSWQGILARMRQELAAMQDVQVVEWAQPKSFDEYTRKIRALQSQVDALVLLGIFNFAGRDGAYVDYEKVLRWTVQHSRLPDLSFWEAWVERGALCAVAVSGFEHGREAGRMARQILVDKVAPAQLTPAVSLKGRPVVSLARAKDLNVSIPASVLLSSKVFTTYAWNH